MSRHHDDADDDVAAVSDNPEWTAADFAEARPFVDVFPDLAAALDESEAGAVQVAIDRDLVEHFKAEAPTGGRA